MPVEVAPERWQAYFDALAEGMTKNKASEAAGIPYKTTQFCHANPTRSSGRDFYFEYMRNRIPDVIPKSQLSKQAKRALEDFEFFRRRYFGHVSTPWQVEAGQEMIKLLESDQKEYVVVNVAPGSGKSTLFTHDIPIWAAVRNRATRTMIGTLNENTGTDYTRRIKLSLERIVPVEYPDDEVAKGLVVHGASTLAHDFGRFKPLQRDYWRAEKLVIAREGGLAAHSKEASFKAWGRQSGFLGGRYDLVVWDDVVTDKNSRTADQVEDTQKWWKNTAETRLEPGGLLILQGQRMFPHDLYRYALDLRDILDSDINEEGEVIKAYDQLARKYHHIVYQAHYEEKCRGQSTHKLSAGARPWPEGCLLDPHRLPWRDLARVKINDPSTYELTYQQADIDPGSVLVRQEFLDGGTHPETHTLLPGCWDTGRLLGQLPPLVELEGKKLYSVVTADPSPTKFWAVFWWLYEPATKWQYLIDFKRTPMEAPDFLDYQVDSRRYTGLLEEWWHRSRDMGRPITHAIFEVNAAQRFVLQYNYVRKWISERGVAILPHTTGQHKADPVRGVWGLQPHFEFGRVRIPAHPHTRASIQPYINEITRYPSSVTDDTVMAHWFLTHNAENLFPHRNPDNPQRFTRPSWLKGRTRGYHPAMPV